VLLYALLCLRSAATGTLQVACASCYSSRLLLLLLLLLLLAGQ
jgi:hypothetical protein